MEKVRKNIDNFDFQILKILSRRRKEVLKVIKYKPKSKIVDQKRIKSRLINIRKKSLKNKIDPRITNRIWKNMIWSYIDYERRNFKKK